jgi:hypothetical protein
VGPQMRTVSQGRHVYPEAAFALPTSASTSPGGAPAIRPSERVRSSVL